MLLNGFKEFFREAFPKTNESIRDYIGCEAHQNGFGNLSGWAAIALNMYYISDPSTRLIIKYIIDNVTCLLRETGNENEVHFSNSYWIFEKDENH